MTSPRVGDDCVVSGVARVVERITVDGRPGYRVTVESLDEGWGDVAARDGWDGISDSDLFNAAVEGMAYLLIDRTSDVADRGIGAETWRAALTTARRILGEDHMSEAEPPNYPNTTTSVPSQAVCGKPYTDRHGDPDTCSFPPNHSGSCW